MTKYTKWWGEVSVVLGTIIYFEAPSLQAYAAAHPTGKIASVIAILLALSLKSSVLDKK